MNTRDTNKWYLWFSSEDTKKTPTPHKHTCPSEHHSNALNTTDLKSLFQEVFPAPFVCLSLFTTITSQGSNLQYQLRVAKNFKVPLQ